MANLREIKQRAKSVTNTQQITRAMKMVAAAKLRKAQERALAARPFAFKLKEMLTNVAGNSAELVHPLLEVREVEKVGIIILTSDKGLAGAYNSNVLKHAKELIDQNMDKQLEFILIGKKAVDYMNRLKKQYDAEISGRADSFKVIKSFIELPDAVSFNEAKEIADLAINLYEKSDLDTVYVVYNKFVSAMSQVPTTVKLLPLETDELKEEGGNKVQDQYIFEPSPEEILTQLLPKYIEIMIYQTLLESRASEHGARMVAMGSATDNAGEIIDRLTLLYNRARQANITTEISEIVSGAEALKA
ncbi:MAG: ATP synthase F1 subunit gamma [bacterium]